MQGRKEDRSSLGISRSGKYRHHIKMNYFMLLFIGRAENGHGIKNTKRLVYICHSDIYNMADMPCIQCIQCILCIHPPSRIKKHKTLLFFPLHG